MQINPRTGTGAISAIINSIKTTKYFNREKSNMIHEKKSVNGISKVLSW
jgi:hypothetical protein